MATTRNRATILIVLAAGATIAGVAVSSGEETAPTRMAVPMSDAPKDPLARVPAEVAERLSAFKRPRRASDALPAAVRDAIAGQLRFGENAALSRAVVTARGRTQYLVPGDGTIGLYDAAGSGATTSARSAVDGTFVMSELCTGAPGLVVTGLLPVDASDAAVVLRDGSRVPLSAPEGVYDVALDVQTAAELPDHVEFTVAGERRSVPVPGATEEVLTMRCRGRGR